MQYVNRIEGLLDALLSREAPAEIAAPCRHCDRGVLAVWRCKDCALPTPMCRHCIRLYHVENPFHRIEWWTGSYFRPANLWEVGSYVLIRHHDGEPLCESLKRQIVSLETTELLKDKAEQEKYAGSPPAPASKEAYRPSWFEEDTEMQNGGKGNRVGLEGDDMDDEQFMQYLEDLKNQVDNGHADENPEMEDELDIEEDNLSINYAAGGCRFFGLSIS